MTKFFWTGVIAAAIAWLKIEDNLGEGVYFATCAIGIWIYGLADVIKDRDGKA